MSAEIRKTIAEFFVFVDFHLCCTEPDSPHRGVFEGGGLFVRTQFEGGEYSRGDYSKEGA